jgi:hypothetical protein
MNDKRRPKFGARVTVRAVLYRERVHEENSAIKRWTEIPDERTGIFLGWRTLSK